MSAAAPGGVQPLVATASELPVFHVDGVPITDLDTIEEGPCGYTYGESGAYTLSATTTWLLPYTSSGGAGSLAPMDRTSTFDYTVREIQTVGVDNR